MCTLVFLEVLMEVFIVLIILLSYRKAFSVMTRGYNNGEIFMRIVVYHKNK
jgi:hypothetical protein